MDLHAREKELNVLHERVRAELEAARQLAAATAADRAALGVREDDMGEREGKMAVAREAWQRNAERKLKVGH
jgi:hypothetical protein